MIFIACFLTVLIEVPFLALFGYRSREDLKISICVNIVTNLLLNLSIQLFFGGEPGPWLYLMEALVVVAENAVYAFAFGHGKGLLVLTISANFLSFILGKIVFNTILTGIYL